MSPIRRRNTRSMTFAMRNLSNISSSVDLSKENDHDKTGGECNSVRKRSHKGKQILVNNIDMVSNISTTNSTNDQITFTELAAVPLPTNNDFNDPSPSSSSGAMCIDPTEELISSRLEPSNYSFQNDCNSSISISRTPISRKSIKLSATTNQASVTSQYPFINSIEKDILMEEERNSYRTPSVVRKNPIICSQAQEEPIIPSIEKSAQLPRFGSSYSCRTSTPSTATRYEPTTCSSMLPYNDSFSIDSISPETYEILSKFPEFRKLLKAYKSERQKSHNWINDYCRLKRKYEQLECNSFPRPSAAALDYLIELVTKIQNSGGQNDPRTNEQLADDLGISPVILSSLKESSPQQSALNVFNHLYSGYRCKVELGSAVNMEKLKPGQLESILVFAQRAAPGVKYTLQSLKDAINNSIRSSRFQLRRAQRFGRTAVNMMDNNGNFITGLQGNQPPHQNNNNQMDMDEEL